VLDFTGSARRLSSIDSKTVDVVITTYGTLRRDAGALAAIRFDYAILDEAQAIRIPTPERPRRRGSSPRIIASR
jgi:SNF2 family DNA or RNA helicase